MDPQLRKLGLTTKLERGVPTLLTPHLICKVRLSFLYFISRSNNQQTKQKGSKLTPEQAQLLKLIGDQMAIFKVRLVGRWDSDEGYVEVEGLSSELEENAAAEDGEDGVEEMET
jgi:mRNA turnover protein 4